MYCKDSAHGAYEGIIPGYQYFSFRGLLRVTAKREYCISPVLARRCRLWRSAQVSATLNLVHYVKKTVWPKTEWLPHGFYIILIKRRRVSIACADTDRRS